MGNWKLERQDPDPWGHSGNGYHEESQHIRYLQKDSEHFASRRIAEPLPQSARIRGTGVVRVKPFADFRLLPVIQTILPSPFISVCFGSKDRTVRGLGTHQGLLSFSDAIESQTTSLTNSLGREFDQEMKIYTRFGVTSHAS